MEGLFRKLHDKRAQLFAQLSDPAAVGVWKMVVDKYSDQAHFLYELLQNADDAGAAYVRILLCGDKLHFLHNGTVPFNITDVDLEEGGGAVGHLNAITSIGASSKTGSNAIGKFGVGFKSVFQYTDMPHIEDDNFSFRLENYIVPVEEEPIAGVRKRGETLFSIPFRNPQKAVTEILEKLKTLSHPLLFLRSLCQIDWVVNDGESGFYKKERKWSEQFSSASCEFVYESDSKSSVLNERYYYVFSRECAENLKYSVAYHAQESGALQTVFEESEAAFCYFPTKERTDLNFLLHAPFLLTDSRESIKQGEEWNDVLLRQLADLSADALSLFSQMRDRSDEPILNDNLFSIIPIEEECFFRKTKTKRAPFSSFSLFYDRFVEQLSRASLFCTDCGYVDAKHTRYTSDDALLDLLQLANNQSNLSFMAEEAMQWTFRSIAQESKAYGYLSKNRLIASEVTAETLLDSVDSEFLKAQNFDFLNRFYGYFSLRKSFLPMEKLRTQLPILSEDGAFRTAFDEFGKPLLFLSSGASATFASVHPKLLQSAECRRLFAHLGIAHPDLISEVECVIFPKYQEDSVCAEDLQSLYQDLNLIVEAYHQFGFMDKRKDRFLSVVGQLHLFPSTDNAGVFALRKASEVYVNLADLRTFLATNPKAAFLDDRLVKEGFAPEKREPFYQFLSAVGVSFGLKIRSVLREPTDVDSARMQLNPKSLRQYDNGNQRLEDREIEGFSSFLENLSPRASVAFFNLLASQLERQSSYMFQLSLEGKYRYVERAKKTDTEEVVHRTSAWHSIFSVRWLYDENGTLKSPSEVASICDLLPDYQSDSVDLLFFLGIADDHSLRGLDAGQRRAVRLVRSMEREGISVARLEKLLDALRRGDLPTEVIAYLKRD